jgi:GMP synthase-like glutamine amidotransferase
MKAGDSTKRLSVLILNAETALDKHVYDPTAHFALHLGQMNVPFSELKIADAADARTLGTATHLIITGSSASVASGNLPSWYESAAAVIRAAIAAGIPTLGVCFGHQLLARIYGGEASVQPAKEPEVGWSEVRVCDDDPVLGPAGTIFSTFNLHFDEVVSLPKNAIHVAQSDLCPIHGFRLTDAPVWGIQSHPEITTSIAHQILTGTKRLFAVEKQPYIEKALQAAALDSGHIRSILHNFLQQ